MYLHVSNLGHQVTNESLAATFSAHGQVTELIIDLDGKTGLPANSAIVLMPKDAEALQALAHINGAVINGRSIRVSTTNIPVHAE